MFISKKSMLACALVFALGGTLRAAPANSDGETQAGTPASAANADGGSTLAQAMDTYWTDFLSKTAAIPEDLDEVAATFSTPDAAFDFVRTQIALEPYAGSMKGPGATLASRGGSPLDRALLLSELLIRQGAKARVVHVTISKENASEILRTIVKEPDAIERSLSRIHGLLAGEQPGATAPSQSGARNDQFIRVLADKTRSLLIERFQKELDQGVAAVGASNEGAQMTALQDQFVVEAEIQGQTRSFDFSGFGSVLAQDRGGSGDREVFDPAAIPAPWGQILTIRLFADYIGSGHVRSEEVMKAVLPTTSLWNQPLRFTILPDDATQPNRNTFLTKVSLGETLVSTGSVNVSVQVRTAVSPGAPQPGLGIGGFGNALLGNLNRSVQNTDLQHAEALGRLRVLFEFAAPGQVALTSERTLLDRITGSTDAPSIDPSVSDDATRVLMLQSWDGVAALGATSASSVARASQRWLQAYRTLRRAGAEGSGGSDKVSLDAAPSPAALSFLLASDLALSDLRSYSRSPPAYQVTPRLVFLRRGFTFADWSDFARGTVIEEGIDLINAPVRVIGDAPQAGLDLQMRLGAADTAIEMYFSAPPTALNAYPTLEAAAQEGVPLVAIGPGRKDDITSLALPVAMQTLLREELATGHTLLLVPARLIDLGDRRVVSSWRVDMSTGYALGMSRMGWGQGATEYGMINSLVSKYSQIAGNLFGGVDRCLMGTIAGALTGQGIQVRIPPTVVAGSYAATAAGYAGIKVITPNFNDLSVVPTSDPTQCIERAACSALADLAGIQAGGIADIGLGWPEGLIEQEEIKTLLKQLTKGTAKAGTQNACANH